MYQVLNKGSRFYILSFMMFCIIFTQTYLRILKDSLVITNVGANAIPIIRIFLVVPVAALLLSSYNRLAKILSYKTIYIISLSMFLLIIFAFAFVINPNIALFQKNSTNINEIIAISPKYLEWFIRIIYNWSYIVFYVIAEVWSDVFYSVLFWTLLNHIYSVKDAIKSYSLMSFFGNSGSIFASSLALYINRFCSEGSSLQLGTIIITIFALLSFSMVLQIEKSEKHAMNTIFDDTSNTQRKKRVGISESLWVIFNSKYLILITLCTCMFYCSINLSEFVFKVQIGMLHKDAFQKIAKFVSICQFFNGISCLILNILLNFLFKRFGITNVINAIPLTVSIFGIVFLMFASQTFLNQGAQVLLHQYSIIQIAVMIGAVTNIISKSTKYAMWDVTKEIFYIPLNKYEKTIGKASVDMISSKLGKSIAALIPFILTLFNASTTIIVLYIFIAISLIWYISTKYLSKSYKEKVEL